MLVFCVEITKYDVGVIIQSRLLLYWKAQHGKYVISCTGTFCAKLFLGNLGNFSLYSYIHPVKNSLKDKIDTKQSGSLFYFFLNKMSTSLLRGYLWYLVSINLYFIVNLESLSLWTLLTW
jgi:hypothetical protein